MLMMKLPPQKISNNPVFSKKDFNNLSKMKRSSYNRQIIFFFLGKLIVEKSNLLYAFAYFTHTFEIRTIMLYEFSGASENEIETQMSKTQNMQEIISVRSGRFRAHTPRWFYGSKVSINHFMIQVIKDDSVWYLEMQQNPT